MAHRCLIIVLLRLRLSQERSSGLKINEKLREFHINNHVNIHVSIKHTKRT